ncbi:MAG: hypothetical protein ACPKPY_11975 [Nitrososphaeraceae archaeon]
MTQSKNSLENIDFRKIKENFSKNESLKFYLSLKITGNLREIFNPNTWEKAYNKFDNTLRITFDIDIKSGRSTLHSFKFVRKAILFWTRNPKIPYRIWVTVVIDDIPFYPTSVEEAKSLLFDIKKNITFENTGLSPGSHDVFANISVSWGKHRYTDREKLIGKSSNDKLNIS